MTPRRALVAIILAIAASASPSQAYEFSTRARAIAQGYQLRAFRLSGPDRLLGRRRFIQTLSLDLWDLGRPRRRPGVKPPRGPQVAFTSYLRLEHDFGDYTSARLEVDGRRRDAIDVIPELEASSVQLDLLYGYLSITELPGGIAVRVGRQLDVDVLDWWSFDGATVTAPLRRGLEVEAFGGLRVRDASPLAVSTFEPDGTSGAACREYVEGATAGGGSWQLIDRSRASDDLPLSSDFELCPQRQQWMPTLGAAVAWRGLGGTSGKLGYRRTSSRTPGVTDPSRLDFPDVGYYPDDFGQEPAWGVNEERLSGELHGRWRLAGGRVVLSPWAAGRYSLLHGLVDRARAGVALRWRGHTVEPEVAYVVPTFDGDSIFNVFGAVPSTDVRLGWSAGRGGGSRTSLVGWVRRYHDVGGAGADDGATAGGGNAAIDLGVTSALRFRGDLTFDDGYGGRRTWASATMRWQRRGAFTLRGQAALLDVDPDREVGARGGALTGIAQLDATWQLGEEATFRLAGEGTSDRYQPAALRAMAIFDLAFRPEI